jgi:hypothetical protein
MRVSGTSIRAVRPAALFALALATTRSATAIEPEARDKARITYDAPDGCPPRETFLTEIRERIGTDWEASGEELARSIDVRVATSANGFTATIAFLDADGGRVERSVGGLQCDEVVQGIALITALAIRSQVLPEEPEASATEPRPPETPTSSVPKPPRTASKPHVGSSAQSARRKAPVEATQWLRVGSRAVMESAAGPELSKGPGGFIALEAPLGVVELAVDATRTGRVIANGVPAEFSLVAARASACAALRFDSGLSLEGGPFFRAGILMAEAAIDPPTVTHRDSGTSAWLAPGLLARVAARYGPVFGEFELDGRFPLERERFYVAAPNGNRTVVYKVAAAGLGAALGLGLHF